MTKGNELDVSDIDFKLQTKRTDKFLCLTLFKTIQKNFQISATRCPVVLFTLSSFAQTKFKNFGHIMMMPLIIKHKISMITVTAFYLGRDMIFTQCNLGIHFFLM